MSGRGFFLILTAAIVVGCSPAKDGPSVQQQVAYLRHGNARGHLTLHTDGRVGARVEHGVSFGAAGSALSFDGDVDFSKPPGSGEVPDDALQPKAPEVVPSPSS